MIAIYRLGEGVQAFPCSENLAFGCQARGAFPFPVPKRWAKDTNRYAQFSFETPCISVNIIPISVRERL